MSVRTRRRHRTLVLSWHPEDGYLSAGGYRRSREIVRRMPAESQLVAVDNSPSIYRDLGSLEVVEYTLPPLRALAEVDRRIARAVQWSLASAKLAWHALREFRHRPFDAIYVPNAELLVCSLPAVAVKALTRRRLVMCNQNVEGIFARGLTLALHSRADAVTVVSDALGRALEREGVRAPIVVTGCGPPVFDRSVVSDASLEKRWDGIFIGRHTTEKGVDDLLDIWARVRRKRPDARLLLVGACAPETKRMLETRIAALGAGGDIALAGIVSDAEKFRLLASSRVLLAPSRVEGWGFVPLEALHVGVPVVCWDLPAYQESLPDSKHVVRVPVGDIDGFAQSTLDVLDNGQAVQAREPPPARPGWPDVAASEWEVVGMSNVNASASPFDSSYFNQPGTTKDRVAADRYVALLKRHTPASGRVLDVGCGTGAVLARLVAEQSWQCEGVDISDDAVRQAAAHAPVVRADAAELPFAAAEFDALLLLDVLEHTESPARVLREARRVTRDGGVLVASTPNAGSVLRPLLGSRWHGLTDPTHVYFFTRFTLEQLLQASGWRPIDRRTFSSAPWGLGWLFERMRIAGEMCVVSEAV